MLLADYVVVGLRGLAFAAMLQAAGGPIFLCLFSHRLHSASSSIRTWCRSAAIAALVFVGLHALTDPARMTGDLRGMFDPSLHAILLHSSAGTTLVVRTIGLILIVIGLLGSRRRDHTVALVGTAMTVASFAVMGHTAASDWRWLLAPLLILHLCAAAFWFGGLVPLLLVTRREQQAAITTMLAAFSRYAIRIVPFILLAGLGMVALLLDSWSVLWSPYGLALTTKTALFALLMLLAAANRWRFGPQIELGSPGALRALQLTVVTEWCLISGILILTAVMTSLFSPS